MGVQYMLQHMFIEIPEQVESMNELFEKYKNIQMWKSIIHESYKASRNILSKRAASES